MHAFSTLDRLYRMGCRLDFTGRASESPCYGTRLRRRLRLDFGEVYPQEGRTLPGHQLDFAGRVELKKP